MRGPEPLPTEDEADRFFTEVPAARSAARTPRQAATTGPSGRPAPGPQNRTTIGGQTSRWSSRTRHRVAAAAIAVGVATTVTLAGPWLRGAQRPPTPDAAASAEPTAAPTAAPTSLQTAEPTAVRTAEPTTVQTAEREDTLANTRVGTCVDSLPGSVLEVVTVTPCQGPDALFVVRSAFALTDYGALEEEADARCHAFLAQDDPASTLDPDSYGVTVPSDDEWAEGYTSGYCLAWLSA